MKKLFKKVTSLFLSLILATGAFVSAVAGSSDFVKNVSIKTFVPNGYVGIYTAADLISVNQNLEKKYILMDDIDLSETDNFIPIGTYDEPFSGIFNGNGYSIKNLSQYADENSEQTNFGLFGVCKNAIIANLAVENISIEIDCPFPVYFIAGGIAAICCSSKIINCTSSGNVDALAGGSFYAGGIVGLTPGERFNVTDTSLISNCESNTNIKMTGEFEGMFDTTVVKYTHIGGIVGELESENKLSLCVNNGKIEAYPRNVAKIGGIAGTSKGAGIENCCNTNEITVVPNEGSAKVGGICGYSSSITTCYNSSKVSASQNNVQVGGIAGEAYGNAKISFCVYSDSNSSAFGNKTTNLSNIKSLNETEIIQKSSYEGFDFEKVWKCDDTSTPDIQKQTDNILTEIELKVNKEVTLPINVIHCEISDNTIAELNEKGEITGKSVGIASAEIITSQGDFETINITVKDSFWGKIVKTILSFFDWFLKIFG